LSLGIKDTNELFGLRAKKTLTLIFKKYSLGQRKMVEFGSQTVFLLVCPMIESEKNARISNYETYCIKSQILATIHNWKK
jgi:hypothetical protein